MPNLADWAARYEVIVLEGCDGTGKTTLATALADHHSYAIVHSDRTPDEVDLTQRYRAILTRPGRLVLDRSFVSELAYGPLRHGRSRLTLYETADLAAMVTARSGALIHLTGQPEEITARLLARDSHAPGTDEISRLISAYADVFARFGGHSTVLTIHTTTPARPGDLPAYRAAADIPWPAAYADAGSPPVPSLTRTPLDCRR